jgi:ABC-type multidrug transport system permease subunit
MPKESIIDRITNFFLSFLYNKFVKEVDVRIRDYVADLGKIVIKMLLLAIVGVVLILFGILFLCMAMVNYISIYFPAWLAWLGVGLVIFFVGFIISMMSLKRK